jgi:acyl dehydratase
MSAAVLRWRPTAEQLRGYSGPVRVRPGDNTHTSAEAARAAGLDDLIVQGHHTLAVGLELLREYAETGDARTHVAAKFTAPVFVNRDVDFEVAPVEEDANAWTLVARVGETVALVADVTFDG